MAWAAINPIVINWPGNSAPPRTTLVAEDAKTWYKGQLGIFTSGTITPVATSGSVVTAVYRFCDDQTTATSTSTVQVQRITAGTRLIMAVQTNGTAGAIAQTNVGTKYGIENIGNVTYLDLGTASGPWLVVDLLSLVDPIMNAVQSYNGSTGVPGWAIVEFTGTVS